MGARVDDLEALFKQYVRGYLEDEVADRLADHEERIAELEQQLESVVGLADGEQSSPDKRATDLAMALIRRAKNRTDEDRYAMWWQDVRDSLADLGHGPPVHKQWCFDAMEDVARADGFGEVKIKNPDGRQVKAVRVRLAELPSESRSTVSNDITTGLSETHGGITPQNRSPNRTET
ncbi:MAG: hypothetical protein U5J98_07075 [Halobacteriales archaeon]|nr:hypothetical protein [Halobacteriales archaeon]